MLQRYIKISKEKLRDKEKKNISEINNDIRFSLFSTILQTTHSVRKFSFLFIILT